ncbi:glycosyltransferase [Nodosilinea sp. LEGE 07298]|uniref:glycosyltransferase family 4 protein n=1 Tax=Nodosilinea sp. LEGE 07298 TaxID=2777970 RepID=UPI001881361A|nr:glycosyltransferase family 4 protein [Nodosilinea sp. LEGE 07298]MBE9110979.1 glycosyltransferase [Nodosilinea sp. LEGE 07298]
MRILMISATFPYPPTLGGTQIRTFYLLKHLGQRHEVTLVTQRSPEVTDDDVATLATYVDKLVCFPRPTAADLQSGLTGKLSRFAHFLATGTPPSTTYLHAPAMQQWIDEWVEGGHCDAITCEHSVNEVFVRPSYHQQMKKVVVDIHSSLYGTLVNQLQTGTAERLLRDRLNLPLLRRYERRYAQKFTDLVITTEEDRQFFAPIAGQTPLHVVPNGVDLVQFPYRSADPGGHSLVFVGAMDYIANVDTAKFLAQAILPLLRQRYSDAALYLVGNKPTADVQALGNLPGVVVTGRVPSVAEYLHRATVCVVPMRIGFGIKNKTLEAMAAGVPVVASDRGLEGLAVDQPQRALRANSVEEYVGAIGQLFEQPNLRATLSARGRELIETTFTWERAGQAYEAVLSYEG